jgi:hypothetical protein
MPEQRNQLLPSDKLELVSWSHPDGLSLLLARLPTMYLHDRVCRPFET